MFLNAKVRTCSLFYTIQKHAVHDTGVNLINITKICKFLKQVQVHVY